jgi:1,4-dihydroxy-2-naphthoate octaprenyltransferase
MVSWRTTARVLFEASRPSQLLLIVGVYALGVKVALAKGATPSSASLAAGLAALLPVAASVHYANEYADYETDALTDRTPFSGGSGALQRTDVSRAVVLRAAVIALAAGAGLASLFLGTGHLPLWGVALLVVIAVFGWQYSLGPLYLVGRGVGELDNAALGGLVLPVYGGAVAGGPLRAVGLAAVPFFLLVLLNLFAVHWPDREADAAVGKRTLAVRWSPRRLRVTYTLVAVAAGLAVLALSPALSAVLSATPLPAPSAPAPLPGTVAAASFLVAPLVVWGAVGYTKRHVPWPTVTAMVGLATVQFLTWCLVAW